MPFSSHSEGARPAAFDDALHDYALTPDVAPSQRLRKSGASSAAHRGAGPCVHGAAQAGPQSVCSEKAADAQLDAQWVVHSDLYIEPVWPMNPLNDPVQPYQGPKSWAIPLRHALVVHTTNQGDHVLTDRGRYGMTFFKRVETGDTMVCMGDGAGCLRGRVKVKALQERLRHSQLFWSKDIPNESQVQVGTIRAYAILHGMDPTHAGADKNVCGGPAAGILQTWKANGCQEYARNSYNLAGGETMSEHPVPISQYGSLLLRAAAVAGALGVGSTVCCRLAHRRLNPKRYEFLDAI